MATVLTGTLSPTDEAVLHSFIGSIDEVFASELLSFCGLPVGHIEHGVPALIWDWQDYETGVTYTVLMFGDDEYVLTAEVGLKTSIEHLSFDELKERIDNLGYVVVTENDELEAYFSQCELRAHCQ